MIETYLSACFVGAITETIARAGRLWLYRKPINAMLNILMMFGLVMGGLSLLVPSLGTVSVFLIATTIGVGYEHLNFNVLSWWDFPDDKFLIFTGKQACALSVGALWGLVPLIVHWLTAHFF